MKKLWKQFKAFINRGNVVDMAVGVIMGSAFSAIVTAFTNILLSVCTWGVPGGLKGLVTVLPAVNAAQKGMDETIGLGQSFASSDLQTLATNLANNTYGESVVTANPNLIESIKTTILSKYTLHGTTYTYNMSAVIDWGTLINACISFIIIALTLFIIVKVFNHMHEKRMAAEADFRKKNGIVTDEEKAAAEKAAADEAAAKEAEEKIAKEEARKQEELDTLKAIKELLAKK
jgi:large-conductance mechanosensitive channel